MLLSNIALKIKKQLNIKSKTPPLGPLPTPFFINGWHLLSRKPLLHQRHLTFTWSHQLEVGRGDSLGWPKKNTQFWSFFFGGGILFATWKWLDGCQPNFDDLRAIVVERSKACWLSRQHPDCFKTGNKVLPKKWSSYGVTTIFKT